MNKFNLNLLETSPGKGKRERERNRSVYEEFLGGEDAHREF